MQNNQMTQFVVNILRQNLPVNYFFHDYRHTLYVMEKSEKIGMEEGITEQEMHLLQAAALWHDVGYIHAYKGHEYESCLLAKQRLPDFGFGENDISQICGMIMATMVPQDPHNKLEEILADADLAYLGTDDAGTYAHELFLELQSLDPELGEAEWIETQLSFLKSHQYFTTYCKKKFEPRKEIYMGTLQKLL